MKTVARKLVNEFHNVIDIVITDDTTEDVNFSLATPVSESTNLWTRQEAIAIRDALIELLPVEHFQIENPL